MMRQYLSNIINDHKTEGEWKIQPIIQLIISSKDSNQTCTMDTKSDNIEIRRGNETDEIIKKLIESLLQRRQEGLEKSMKGREFIFHSVDLPY